jgi:hypothetical protein
MASDRNFSPPRGSLNLQSRTELENRLNVLSIQKARMRWSSVPVHRTSGSAVRFIQVHWRITFSNEGRRWFVWVVTVQTSRGGSFVPRAPADNPHHLVTSSWGIVQAMHAGRRPPCSPSAGCWPVTRAPRRPRSIILSPGTCGTLAAGH